MTFQLQQTSGMERYEKKNMCQGVVCSKSEPNLGRKIKGRKCVLKYSKEVQMQGAKPSQSKYKIKY